MKTKPYKVLKDFAGSQTGNDGPHRFLAGTAAGLTDHLAEVALKEGYVEPADGTEPARPSAPAEGRETKVTGPEETKPAKPLARMNKAELAAHGLAPGLAPFPDAMTAKEMIDAIEKAA